MCVSVGGVMGTFGADFNPDLMVATFKFVPAHNDELGLEAGDEVTVKETFDDGMRTELAPLRNRSLTAIRLVLRYAQCYRPARRRPI